MFNVLSVQHGGNHFVMLNCLIKDPLYTKEITIFQTFALPRWET